MLRIAGGMYTRKCALNNGGKSGRNTNVSEVFSLKTNFLKSTLKRFELGFLLAA
jgi:hypothetical protein